MRALFRLPFRPPFFAARGEHPGSTALPAVPVTPAQGAVLDDEFSASRVAKVMGASERAVVRERGDAASIEGYGHGEGFDDGLRWSRTRRQGRPSAATVARNRSLGLHNEATSFVDIEQRRPV